MKHRKKRPNSDRSEYFEIPSISNDENRIAHCRMEPLQTAPHIGFTLDLSRDEKRQDRLHKPQAVVCGKDLIVSQCIITDGRVPKRLQHVLI